MEIHMSKFYRSGSGFALIELLVVLIVLSLFAVGAFAMGTKPSSDGAYIATASPPSLQTKSPEMGTLSGYFDTSDRNTSSNSLGTGGSIASAGESAPPFARSLIDLRALPALPRQDHSMNSAPLQVAWVTSAGAKNSGSERSPRPHLLE